MNFFSVSVWQRWCRRRRRYRRRWYSWLFIVFCHFVRFGSLFLFKSFTNFSPSVSPLSFGNSSKIGWKYMQTQNQLIYLNFFDIQLCMFLFLICFHWNRWFDSSWRSQSVQLILYLFNVQLVFLQVKHLTLYALLFI